MAYRQLTKEERYQISVLRTQGFKNPAIAAALQRHPSTIAREVKRNATPYDGAYRPSVAVEMTNGRRKRSRRNARYEAADYAEIEMLLKRDWSPEQIVGERRSAGRPVMSHETIYVHVRKDKANGGSLWRRLRGAPKRRRKRYGRSDHRGRVLGKRSIQDRPALVERRKRFGDLEMDTMHGKGNPCILTVVDRKSGFVHIGPLPRATVEHTNARLFELLAHEPHKIRTITADNGSEFHGFKAIERELNLKVYFATPHHAWERGTNENTNGLIRQYLPKGCDLGNLTQRQCDAIAAKLNHRPRRRLGFRTPHQVYYGSVLSPRH